MKSEIRTAKNHVLKLRDFFLDILFPVECVGCEKEKEWLCEHCLNQISLNHIQYCLNCKTSNKFGEFCETCEDDFYINGIFIAGDYQNEILSKSIKIFKYRFIKDLSKVLGQFISQFLFLQITKENCAEKPKFLSTPKDILIIPVPLHKKRENWRGFNQSEELAKTVAEKFDLKISTDLKRIKYKKPQVKYKRQTRKENIKNSFAWQGKNLDGKNILLIDDVTTTGSTLDECAKILKESNAQEVWGLVLANG